MGKKGGKKKEAFRVECALIAAASTGVNRLSAFLGEKQQRGSLTKPLVESSVVLLNVHALPTRHL